MDAATTLVIICLIGLTVCLNPIRRMPNYGRKERASIRNLYY